MGALRKHQANRADPEWCANKDLHWRIDKDSDFRVSRAQKMFSGYIFICNNSTMPADLKRKIFGLPANHLESVQRIRKGMPLFLYNYSTRLLHGVFEAASDGGYNIDPYAWDYVEMGRHSNPISRYPAQVRVHIRTERPPLDEDAFRPVLDRVEGMRFKLELTFRQVQDLLRIFAAPSFSTREPSIDHHRSHSLTVARFAQDLEVPGRFPFRSDTDKHREHSSRGTSIYEDGWVDECLYENKMVKENDLRGTDSEEILGQRLSNISLNNMHASGNDAFERDTSPDVPYDLVSSPEENEEECEQFNHFVNGHELGWEETTQGTAGWSSSETDVPQGDNPELLRFLDADSAVNSNTITWIQPDTNSLRAANGDNDATFPMIASQLSSPFIANGEKMIFIPLQAVPCEPRETNMTPEWSEIIKSSRSESSRKRSQDRHSRAKDSRLWRERVDCDDQVTSAIEQQKFHISQVLVPIKGLIPEQGQIATLLSPLFMHGNREGITLAVPPTNLRIDGNEVKAINSGGSVIPGSLQQLLNNGQCPILLMPSVIPRVSPNPPPITDSAQGLHFDILHFAKLTRPSSDIQRYVEIAIAFVQRGVKMLWPDADVEVFGSFATGLCLQHSDVDLAVIDAPALIMSEGLTIAQASASLIRELATVLMTYEWCESINALDTATVPVLKCRCRPFPAPTDCATLVPSIAVDITIGSMRDSDYIWSPYSGIMDVDDSFHKAKNHITRHTGGAAREYVLQKIQELPALAPLVLLLKSYLHHKNLSNVYLGGLGSFSLTLLLAFYLERVPIPREVFPEGVSVDMPASPTLSRSSPFSCSSDFSDDSDTQSSRSGNGSWSSNTMFDPATLSLGGQYVKRAAEVVDTVLSRWSTGSMPFLGILLLGFLQTFGVQRDLSSEKIVLKGPDGDGGLFKRDDRHVALWIDDPLRPGINVGAGSFAMNHVQTAFKDMFQVLTKRQVVAPLHCDESDCQDLDAMGRLSHLSLLIMEAGNC